jgi:predicted dehydrogenase
MKHRPTRRDFIKTATAAIAFPTIIPSSARGADGTTAPSNRIVMASIGWGMQGPSNTQRFISEDDCELVAICDIDKNHQAKAVQDIDKWSGKAGCKGYHDYKEMLARDDIDAVMIAVPDHWHALVAIEAAKNKKDIYGEKPLAKTIAEQQAIVKAAQENKIIWQTGSWQRSGTDFRRACELVINGLVGKVTTVEVGLPSGHNDFAGTKGQMAVVPVPPELDYETWIGPSTMMDYIPARIHKNWRWNYNTGGGQLLDWIGHHCDIAHWGLGFDLEGPSEVSGVGEFPDPGAVWNTATKYRIEAKYPKDITMIIAGGYNEIAGGTKWIGPDGWVYVNRGKFDASNKEWLGKDLPDDVRKIKLIDSPGHYRNFLDSVKSRQPTITPVEVAHHSAIPGHLGQMAMELGRTIKWDNAKEEIIGDEEATKKLGREYRAPYKLG